MKLVLPSWVSIQYLPGPCPSPLARKLLRHLPPTQPSARERDKGTGTSRELWDTGASHGGPGKTSRKTRHVSRVVHNGQSKERWVRACSPVQGRLGPAGP